MGHKVSICIPAFKNIRYLRKALDSIVIQTYKNYEVIITDDSSDDSIYRLVREYDFGESVKYFKNNERKGVPENWNEAQRHSSGEYIKTLHDDDWFTYEDSLAEYVKMLDSCPEADFAFSAIVAQYNEVKSEICQASAEQVILLEKEPTVLYCRNFVGGPSATIYRKKVNKLYDQNLKWVVDIDFYINVLHENNRFVYTPRPLITGLRGTKDAVTDSCLNNKDVEIYEYFYLLNKIKRYIPQGEDRKYLFSLFNRIIRYKIKSPEEIRACGYKSAIPSFILLLLFLNNLSPTVRRIFIRAWKICSGKAC